VETCEAHKVAPGLLAPIGPVERTIQQGFRLISLGGDLAMLASGVANALENARTSVKSP